MPTSDVGVQTSFDEDRKDVSLKAVQRRLYRLIKGLPPGSSDMGVGAQGSFDSILLEDSHCFKSIASKQVDYLPRKPVSGICMRDEGAFAVAMLHRESLPQTSGIGEIYTVDVEATIPTLSMRCIFGISRLLFPKETDNILLGGSVCGSVHIWDTDSRHETHVIAPNSIEGHIDPIVALELLDDDCLLSVDSAGKAFTWSLRNLSKPTSRMDWAHKEVSSRVSATWYNSILYCGTMNGHVYGCSVDNGPSRYQKAHNSVITAVATSRAGGVDKLATSSFDCKLKIWDCNDLSEPILDIMPSIHCVTGLSWSPVSPTVLASVDGHGNLSIWNFSENREMPVCKTQTDDPHTFVAWSPSGRLLVLGGLGVTIIEPSIEMLLHGGKPLSKALMSIRGKSSYISTMSYHNNY